jgi:hypothetical protein
MNFTPSNTIIIAKEDSVFISDVSTAVLHYLTFARDEMVG